MFSFKTSKKYFILQHLRYVRLIDLNTFLKTFTKRSMKSVFKTSEKYSSVHSPVSACWRSRKHPEHQTRDAAPSGASA